MSSKRALVAWGLWALHTSACRAPAEDPVATANADVADALTAESSLDDSSLADGSVADSSGPSPTDALEPDSTTTDTRVADTFVADTRLADTFVADTFVADTFVGTKDASAAAPSLGAHAFAFYKYYENDKTSIATPPMAVATSGSVVVVGVGRGVLSAFALPTGVTSGKPFTQLGTAHAYSRWTSSGTATYALTGATLSNPFVVQNSTVAWDEITVGAVEVRNATKIQAAEWNEVLSGAVKSKSVTTTGPATLIAFWWGDATADLPKTAVPNNGFVVIDSLLEAGGLVQCAVAVKAVSAAGTYDVTWTATPAQGAQLWLVAVQ